MVEDLPPRRLRVDWIHVFIGPALVCTALLSIYFIILFLIILPIEYAKTKDRF